METKEVKILVSKEYLENLKKQKSIILAIQSSNILPENLNQELDGILGAMDEIQDQLVDIHGISQSDVFDYEGYNKIESEINKNKFMEIDVNKLGNNPFKEVRNDYCEHDTGLIFIDCWVSDDDDDEGISVATVNKKGEVFYKYPQEHFGSSAVQEAIAEAIKIQKENK